MHTEFPSEEKSGSGLYLHGFWMLVYKMFWLLRQMRGDEISQMNFWKTSCNDVFETLPEQAQKGRGRKSANMPGAENDRYYPYRPPGNSNSRQ